MSPATHACRFTAASQLLLFDLLPDTRPGFSAVLEVQLSGLRHDQLPEHGGKDQALVLMSYDERGEVIGRWLSQQITPALGVVRLLEGSQVALRLAVLGAARREHVRPWPVLIGVQGFPVEDPRGD